MIFEFAGVRRPFEFEKVTVKEIRVQLALNGVGVNDLAAFLTDGLELDEFARNMRAEFFMEFAGRGLKDIFAGLEFAFWYRPGSQIFISIVRPAGVDQQNFQDLVFETVH